MNRVTWALLLLLVFSGCALADDKPLRLDQQGYIQELDRWTSVIQSAHDGHADIPADVPPEWIVTVDGDEYHVSTSFLARDLTKPDEANAALERLTALRQGIEQVPPSQAKVARATANQILQRREYRRVHMPGAEQSFRDRFNAWLQRVLSKIFGKAFEHVEDLRVLSDIIVWGLLLGAAAVLLFWLRRILLRAAQQEMHLGGAPGDYVSAKAMEQWLAEARDAASRGEYRLAVRLAYWGAISALERAGAWKPDRARTPREYLRLTRGSQHESTLRPLTRDFERLWYAKQPATEADFLACMARVEELARS
jgi:hypothetical protein